MGYSSYKKDVRNSMNKANEKLLEAMGSMAVSQMKLNAPVGKKNGGNYRSSLSHEVQPDFKSVRTGSSAAYAVFLEMGTGIYALKGDGRKTPWFYEDENTGELVFTRGMRPQRVLRKSIDQVSPNFKKLAKMYNPE